ncbi:MAG TPA: single-stranded-DNA-specific exonuclease RecJ [Anaerolineaceae bacterium]|nr:single-stranded-DNA-specific exonuclease RecJ [Anaerolineaceae bacterium]
MPKTPRQLAKRWITSPLIPPNISRQMPDVSPFLRQLLYNRGIESNEAALAYISGDSPTNPDPFQMLGMHEAVEVLHNAIQSGQKIAIYGDYDADGVTSSAILYEFLAQLGLDARVYIPNRFDEGYGLNLEAIEQLADEGVKLLITVDCGISSVAEVARASELGMRVIITDHHQVPEVLPDAAAIINPHRPTDPYPYKELAGVGIAWKLVVAYLQRYPNPEIDPDQWLDLVAIGTVVDVAELNGENRSLVKRGLALMRMHPRQGLFSLSQVAGIKLDQLNAGHLGFGIGPRLNAAGRMDSAMAAFELLVTQELFEAARLAQDLDNKNQERKNLLNEIEEIAVQEALASDEDFKVIFVASEDFNQGLVGLAAGRIVESLYKPAIVGHIEGDKIVASARSIEELNIHETLKECEDLLEKHGGHAMAAGLTLKLENVDAFVERINQVATEKLGDMTLLPILRIDYDIDLARLKPEHIPGILNDVAQLEPTGHKNPDALFSSHHCQALRVRTVGNGAHLKFSVRDGQQEFDAIAFRQGHWVNNMPDYIDIAYTVEINEYMGMRNVQLNVKDIKKSEPKPA